MPLDFETISRQVREVVGLPRARHLTSYQDPTYRAVHAVFTSITKALQRGEAVRVIGLGTFTVRTVKARTINGLFAYQQSRNFTSVPVQSLPYTIPEHKEVSFKPCKSLKRLVNETQPHA